MILVFEELDGEVEATLGVAVEIGVWDGEAVLACWLWLTNRIVGAGGF